MKQRHNKAYNCFLVCFINDPFRYGLRPEVKIMLVIEDENQINALVKAICVLKFENPQDDPDNAMIVGSPCVAEVVNKAYDALLAVMRSKGNHGTAHRQEQARNCENNLIVLEAAKTHIKIYASFWNGRAPEEKKEYLRIVLSPYMVSEDFSEFFISECNELCAQG